MGGNGNYYPKQGYGGGYGYGGQQNQDAGGMYGAADASAAYGSNGYDNHQQQPVS